MLHTIGKGNELLSPYMISDNYNLVNLRSDIVTVQRRFLSMLDSDLACSYILVI